MTTHRHAFVYRRNRPDLAAGSSQPAPDRLLNIDQVRRRLNCSRSHVYNLIQTGQLPATTLGESKGKRVYESTVEAFIARKHADPDPDPDTDADPDAGPDQSILKKEDPSK